MPYTAPTILVVDDEAPIRQLMRRILENQGYAVLEATTYDEALKTYRRHRGTIRLVITDISLPGNNGYELAAEIRQLDPEVPVIYMSGRAGMEFSKFYDMPETDPRHSIIEKIVKQTFRASEIVNNLLNFSRTGATEIANVDVNHVVEETLSLVSHPLKTSQIHVVKNLGEGLPAVRGSANKLQQVFLNLFLNARDAMPTGGILEVRTSAHNGSVEIEVVDTGAGIPREHINRIFDPFFTTKASGRGTGLGLSVSYGIIKEHAGKVDVRSAPGKGTSFHVELPAVRKPVHV